MKSSQVTASANGWVFQVSAGIVLTLEHIRDVEKIKMEGASEDIELTFSNGKGIYAQAKSVERIDDTSNNLHHLKKALISLEKVSNDRMKLVYITNIRNPLNSSIPENYYSDGNYSFSSGMTMEDQAIIRRYVSSGFRFEDFSVYKLYFFGEGDDAFKSIRDKIKLFLVNINIDNSYNQKLLENWFLQYITNCREKTLHLSKKDFIFPLILIFIEPEISESIQEKLEISDIYDKVRARYRDLISDKAFRFEFVSKVLSDYQKLKGSDLKETYVCNYWNQYIDEFITIDPEYVEPLIKTIIWKIIHERQLISRVKSEVNL